MPWKVSHAVDQRKQLLLDYEQGEPIAELGRRFEVSRQTVYKWLDRYRQSGEDGLADRSPAPHRHPQQCPEAVRERVLALRAEHARWGPRKLRAYLERHQPGPGWPAASTIGDWLRAEGLSHPRRKRRRTPPMSAPLSHATAAHHLWCADFKGWFRTADGARIDPFTVTDAATRFLIRCVAVEKTDTARVRAVMEAAFREHGMPLGIRTDNGAPFASPAPAGLSRLALWWIRLGIRHERIEPGEPQQNGRHERFHLTLQQETAAPPAASRAAQQRLFQSFQEIYNRQRPHQALQYETPQDRYQPSPRAFPSRLPEPEFPSGAMLRRVAVHGDLKWRGERVFVSEVLAHEPVGLRRADDRYWAAYYGPVLLGWLDDRELRFVPAHRPPADLQSEQG
jgi:transposase InsO family protein